MKLINLTPHALNIIKTDGTVITIPPSGTVARCTVTGARVGEVEGITLTRTSLGEVTGIPAPTPVCGYCGRTNCTHLTGQDTCGEDPKLPQEAELFVVSLIVRQALPHRTDIASPGELVRGADGQPIGCRGLTVN